MPGIMQALQQFQPAHAGKIGIDQQAGLPARGIGMKERLARLVILDNQPVFLQHGAKSVAYLGVVVDDIDDGGIQTAGCRVRAVGARALCAIRRPEEDDG